MKIEEFEGFIETVIDGIAYGKIKSKETGEVSDFEFPFKELEKHGIKERSRFKYRYYEEFEAIPNIKLGKKQKDDIITWIEGFFPKDDLPQDDY